MRIAEDFPTSTNVPIVVLKGLRKLKGIVMARVVITLKIMPENVEVDLEGLFEKIKAVIPNGTDVRAHEIVPIAFGLKAIRMNIARDESLGGTDELEKAIVALEGVSQVEVEMLSRM